MDSITISLAVNSINVSVQIGDIAFFQDSDENVVYIGGITSIDYINNTITCDILPSTPRPSQNDFIFFVKDQEINQTGLKGHYALMRLNYNPLDGKNSELFSTSCEVVKSS